jgi:hypothetical protein
MNEVMCATPAGRHGSGGQAGGRVPAREVVDAVRGIIGDCAGKWGSRFWEQPFGLAVPIRPYERSVGITVRVQPGRMRPGITVRFSSS